MIFNASKFIVPAALMTILSGVFGVSAIAADKDVYGPVNLFKTMKTPFTMGGKDDGGSSEVEATFAPITMGGSGGTRHLSLSQRLVPTRLYLPSKMVLGRSHEFAVKAKPGMWVAIAMADKTSGAKPILGHQIHLGSDRKLVALGQIPETGVVELDIETPIQGDLIGQSLYFEAAIWSKPDFSDLEFATPVRSDNSTDKESGTGNGVLIAAEGDMKKGLKIYANTVPMSPLLQNAGGSLGNNIGRPQQ